MLCGGSASYNTSDRLAAGTVCVLSVDLPSHGCGWGGTRGLNGEGGRGAFVFFHSQVRRS